jgi:hypothetical protein
MIGFLFEYFQELVRLQMSPRWAIADHQARIVCIADLRRIKVSDTHSERSN